MLERDNKLWVESVVTKINEKMIWVSKKSRNKIPYTTKDGLHDDYIKSHKEARMNDGISWWTNGFWGGIMWLMYKNTGHEEYATIARISEEKLDQAIEEYYGLHHDVGFMWLPTSVANYRITNNPESRKRGLHAANLLAGRFNPVGKFIRAWNEVGDNDTRGWGIIDCMLNLPLLYWATNETGDPRFKQIAMMHADTAMESFIRQDGSSAHIVEFDPLNGGLVTTHGGQGYKQGSSWTRGQAWAIYGFILSYIHTDKIEYLETAKGVADYFIKNLPDSAIVPVDFMQPEEDNWEDSSAAAIAACGMIEISKILDKKEKEFYLNSALKLLKTIEEKRCNWTKENDCIVENCSESYDGKEHINMVYADYFFIEAILKLNGEEFLMW